MAVRPPKALLSSRSGRSLSSGPPWPSPGRPSSPRVARAAETDPLGAALDQEILAEKVATYGRLLRRLERALAELAEHDQEAWSARQGATGKERDQEARRPEGPTGTQKDRPALVAAAGEALWHAVVARELLGLTNTARFLAEMGVPGEVILKMGVTRA